MPITKEFTIRLEDRPGTLGKLCQALAEEDINILAYQQFPHDKGRGSVRLVVDNPDKTRATLDRQRNDYTETEVARVDRKSTRLNSSHSQISYAVFCLKKYILKLFCIKFCAFCVKRKNILDYILYFSFTI